jgi:hypothetical protein
MLSTQLKYEVRSSRSQQETEGNDTRISSDINGRGRKICKQSKAMWKLISVLKTIAENKRNYVKTIPCVRKVWNQCEFQFFCFYLQVKVKGAKMALTLDERVAPVYAVKIRDLRRLRQAIAEYCASVDPNMLSKIGTNMVKRLRKCVVSG